MPRCSGPKRHRNSVTFGINSEFVAKLSLKIQPRLKRVATLFSAFLTVGSAYSRFFALSCIYKPIDSVTGDISAGTLKMQDVKTLELSKSRAVLFKVISPACMENWQKLPVENCDGKTDILTLGLLLKATTNTSC